MTSSRAAHERYLFGRFSLSTDGSLLEQQGVAIHLAPKALKTLLVLVEHAGKVVRKDDLLHAVWPDTFVEETGLTRNISVLRQALGDDGPRFIVTVARIGYRFTVAVELDSARDADSQTPMVVGRDHELRALRTALDRARSGRGGIIGIVGEPGIGKTTVVEQALGQLRGVHIARGRCSERLAGTEPHLPLLEALQDLCAIAPDVVPELWRLAPTWADYIEPRAGGREASRHSGNPERLMRELTTFLQEISQQRLLVIFVDDLHWADTSTIDALTHLAPRLLRSKVLIVLTYRQREMLLAKHPFVSCRATLIARGELSEIDVALLDHAAVRKYVESQCGRDADATDLATLVFKRSEGNPLFMTELVRFMRQRGLEARELVFGRDAPDSLRALIGRLLIEVEADARTILSVAAIRGDKFDSTTIARASGHPLATVEEWLRASDLTHGIVRLLREEVLPDGTITLLYQFVHVLYQEALADSVPPSARAEWSHRIAAELARAHAGDTDAIAGSLATLFETGREYWEASKWFLATSQNAMRLFAFAAATDLATRGLTCLAAARGVNPIDLRRRELALTSARLVPLASLKGYASQDVEQLTALLVELADAVDDVSGSAAALVATWIVRIVRGDCEAARDAGLRLQALAEREHDPLLLINAHMQTQIACHHLGDFRQAQEHADAVMALAPDVAPAVRCISVLDPVVASIAESARNHWITGQLSQAVAESEKAVEIGRTIGHPDSLAFAWLFHAWIRGYAGDWRGALDSSEQGIRIAEEAGSVQTLAWNRCVRAWALAHLGEAERGETELADGVALSKQIMGRIALPQFYAMMAEVRLLRDDVNGAAEYLHDAEQLSLDRGDRYFAAEVQRLAAACLVRRGELGPARDRLINAIAIARQQGAATFEGRATSDLAALDEKTKGPAETGPSVMTGS